MIFRTILPEVVIAAAMIAIMLILSVAFDMPIIYPTGERAAFVGIHYIYPLAGIALLGVATFAMGNRAIGTRFLIALPCYALVLFAHFNIKLWIPHINPMQFDQFYWNIDQIFRPVVDACIGLRTSLFAFIPYEANFYMVAYIAMFYVSFLFHAVKTPDLFGKLVVSALILQALGTVGYLLAPAVGPFIYEQGVNPLITAGQHSMLAFYNQSVSGGPAFLVENGGPNFTGGLAAMPSLHSASAYLFFLFAYKHGRILLPLYAFVMVFILVSAVASRWHYLIDLPVGMLIAWVSYRLADRLTGRDTDRTACPVDAELVPALS